MRSLKPTARNTARGGKPVLTIHSAPMAADLRQAFSRSSRIVLLVEQANLHVGDTRPSAGSACASPF
jgi:hypothetical protein